MHRLFCGQILIIHYCILLKLHVHPLFCILQKEDICVSRMKNILKAKGLKR